MLLPRRILDLRQGVNFRELGGYQTTDGRLIKWQRLLRSGSLFAVSTGDTNQLIAYGWGVDIDLRGPAEISTRPDPPLKNVSYQNISIYPFASDQNSHWFSNLWHHSGHTEQPQLTEMYSKLIADPHAIQAYRAIMHSLLKAPVDQAILFHCAAGQDRTGVTAIIIEAALGLPIQTIQQDYFFTALATRAAFNPATRAQVNQQSTKQPPRLQPTATAQKNWQILTTTLQEQYGTWQNYLQQGLEFSVADQRQLQDRFLTD